MTVTLRTVGVRLTAEIADYQGKLKAAGQSTRDFKGEIDKAAQKGNLDAVAERAGVLGLGLAGVAVAAVKMSADFDKSMSSVAAATHAPASEMAALRAAALQAGKDTMYSATEAADAITELSKAGVSTANILNGGLKGALSLAAAGQLDVGEAAEIASSAMTQFKLSGDQVPHVADLLAAAAGKAQGSVHDLGYALSQSGLVASQFGLSVEDTTGVLAEFASAGLLGSDAGTSLKTMLLALANPSQQTRREMDQLGISFYDAQGKFVGVSGVAQILQQRLKDLTVEQRNQALAQIFGNDAIRGASILYTDGAAGVNKWKAAVNDSGYAAETAAKQTDNLAGDMERLRGSIDTVAIEAGGGANSGLRVLVKVLNQVVNQFADMNPITGEVLVGLAAVSGGLLLGGAAWIKYRKIVTEAQDQLIATGPAGEKAATAIGKMSGALGQLGALAGAAEGLTLLFNSIDEHTPDVDKLTNSLQNLVQTGKTAGELKTDFGDNLKDLGKVSWFADQADHGFGKFILSVAGSVPVFGTAGEAIGNFLSRMIAGTDMKTATAQMQALDQAMAQQMQTTNNAAQASKLWNDVLLQSGMNTDELAKLLPTAYKEVGSLNTAADKSGGALGGMANAAGKTSSKLGDVNSALAVGSGTQDAYATEAASVTGVLHGQADAFISLAKQLKAASDPAFAFISAQDGMAAAQKAATKAIKEHGATSAQAKTADRQLVTAALDLQDAAGRASSTLTGKMDPALTQTLQHAGLTKAEIANVSTQLKIAKTDADKYTGKYAADVSAPGAPGATKQLNDAYTAANHFAGPYRADVSVTNAESVAKKLQGLSQIQQDLAKGVKLNINPSTFFHGLAEGGWTGPGSKYQPAGIVHADEYVIKASSRRQIESTRPGLLDSMNSTGSVGYAGGGHVWPYRTNVGGTKIPTQQQVIGAVVGGAGGGSLGAWIREGIALAGVPASWAGPLRTLIMRESGGNPRSINLWDSNAKAGHPSQGLMQTIPSTFEHYRLRSLPDEIMNPIANIVAGLRYIESRYGSIFNVQQANAHLPPKGYANGGWINEPVSGVGASGQRYTFAEHRPEYVDPHWQPSSHFGGAASTYHVTVVNHGVIGSRAEADDFMAGSISRLKQRGRV